MHDERLAGTRGVAVAHAAVTKSGNYDLPVTRQNYEIWLAYLLGTSPDLTNAIQMLTAGRRTPTAAQFEDLYARFFSGANMSAHVLEAGSRIADEIAAALEALRKTGVTADKYGEALLRAIGMLAQTQLDDASLRKIQAALATATAEMARQNDILSQQLANSSREMEALRTSLRKARTEALTDSLTGLANRKLFDETLRLRREEADREASPLALVMCDIDHFKTFNDTWGHQTGDQVIRFVATCLAKLGAPDHLVARYGGEEFAIILPRTTLIEAARLADLIRRSVEGKRLMRRSTNDSVGPVTVSFGAALYDGAESQGSLVARADECLYLAKNSGRNRVTTEIDLRRATEASAAAS